MKLLWFIPIVVCSLVIIKPDIFERSLLENAIGDLTPLGISNIKGFTWTAELVADFYKDHVEKPFFSQLSRSLINKRSLALLVKSSVKETRERILDLRKKFAKDTTENSFHASDSQAEFQRERSLLNI